MTIAIIETIVTATRPTPKYGVTDITQDWECGFCATDLVWREEISGMGTSPISGQPVLLL